MKAPPPDEYCLIVEGSYADEPEALHALRDPFIEDLVERTGRFRIHQLDEMEVVPGVKLGRLGVVKLGEGVFEVASTDAEHPLTEHKARRLADAVRRQAMFDEIEVTARSLEFDDEGEEAEGPGPPSA